jgi:hypothetical protein
LLHPLLGDRRGQRPVVRLRRARWNLCACRERAAVYGEYGSPYAPRPVYYDRAPAYPERYYAQDYNYEYAPRPPLPVPYRSRVRARCDDGYGGWTYCD